MVAGYPGVCWKLRGLRQGDYRFEANLSDSGDILSVKTRKHITTKLVHSKKKIDKS